MNSLNDDNANIDADAVRKALEPLDKYIEVPLKLLPENIAGRAPEPKKRRRLSVAAAPVFAAMALVAILASRLVQPFTLHSSSSPSPIALYPEAFYEEETAADDVVEQSANGSYAYGSGAGEADESRASNGLYSIFASAGYIHIYSNENTEYETTIAAYDGEAIKQAAMHGSNLVIVSESSNRAYIRIYDISQPKKPPLSREFMLEGAYIGSTVSNGTVYLQTVIMYEEGHIPPMYKDSAFGNSAMHFSDDEMINYMPNMASGQYSALSAIVIGSELPAEKIALAYTGEEYLMEESLIALHSVWDSKITNVPPVAQGFGGLFKAMEALKLLAQQQSMLKR
ncbi:MAG: beta-propeller domain-containing protein [Eubacteriaceae bacterium]|nr:beta-propeller domain-containing protein [Eubacteriaceae bacterium]